MTGTQHRSRDPRSDLRIWLEWERGNASRRTRGPEEASKETGTSPQHPVPGPIGDAALARRTADGPRPPRLRFRKGLWERPRSRRAKMAEAAESPGDPGTALPRPLFAGLSDISISQDIPVEGEITIPLRSRIREFDSSTLNESVQNTIMRDLKAVGKKFMHVLYPRKSNTLLRDWDLWGPLILCVTLALMLQRGSADSENDGGPQFAEVFVIIWFGAVTITLNSKLLGGNISFFQSLCVLGYCILPLTVALLVCRLVLLAKLGPINFIVRLFVVIVMFAWSMLASTAFLADSQPPNRKALAVYPVFLFYFVISWMILTFTP
ncbi:PREDICTED: LOW QUALITY PROTEIN: protein YIPF6 [Miniopterus natalensis]|uniref:LOW QUALITY PROTEIN: protein YIPF6 n=1 Tax=Miniopterus natalensis TaxID=291302 RepID=UPI0007A6D59C|nr:PREDICTED: LOW QUALITY PROTEIN: protein YIPF6 [Miniopterus natalensis]